ncbi:centrosomal protein of 290 kDa-like [Macrosteles quadrilineatus]|uniref:centrosomal protein of 290 kDa-like n=1 Tax=Macrosteles quadrilineatus TaxID=74068 RepID=UPI0023E1B88A|nr:centrosomal protein of 290 kDa-like [Macrosteles quadrilineatus]
MITAAQSVEKESGRRDDPGTAVSLKAMEFIDAIKAKKQKPQLKPEKEGSDSKLKEEVERLNAKLKETKDIMAEEKELYESDKDSWLNVRKGLQDEVNSLTDKVASLSAQVKEYSTSWQALQDGPDAIKTSLANATIRLGDLSSENEKLKRKSSVLQELQTQMKNEKDCLQEELVLLKNSSKHSIEELKRERDKLDAELKVLQSSHSLCYPFAELEEAKKQINELTVKYRDLITSKTSLDDANNKLINLLKAQVELLQQDGEQKDKIPEKEFKLIKQNDGKQENKSHAEKMYSLVKDQLKESEEHCKELEGQLAGLVQQNLALQLVEAELRDQLVNSVPHSRLVELREQLTQSEKLVLELKAEQSKLEERVSSAEDKAKALEELRHCHDYQHDSLQRQVLELTASSEDKATIGRLTRELLRAQESELAASKQIVEMKTSLEKLQNMCSEQERNMKNICNQHLREKTEMQSKYRWLARTVSDLHQRYLGHLSLLSTESMQSMLAQARYEKTNALAAATAVMSADKVVEMVNNQYNEADGVTASKLQELKLKVQVQSLESQLAQTEGQLHRIEKLSAVLQEELVYQENCWENKQVIWEQKLLENLSVTSPTEEKTKSAESSDDVVVGNITADVTEVSTGHPEVGEVVKEAAGKQEKETVPSPKVAAFPEPKLASECESIRILNNQLNQVTTLMNEQAKKLNQCETEISELKSKMESLKRQLDDKESKLKNKEKELLDLQTSLTDKEKEKIEEESTEILALKATVASLQNIVNQKEETIGRYQTLLQESRDEHSITVANLQQELTSLQQTLDKKDKPADKEGKTKGESMAMKVILERYLAKVRSLEDDLSQTRDQAARLVADLAGAQQQTDRWTHTAEERLKTIQEMKQRLDSARSKEDLTDTNSELMEKSAEIDSLNRIISNLKAKLESRETVSASRDRLRGELDRANKRIDVIQNQNTELKSEVQRLRKQLTLRQSSTPKSEVVSTAREEVLQKKIKQLEEQLADYQVIVQKGKEIHKSKCDQEFVKWEEKKKWQTSNDKLKAQLKEKSCQVEALRANIDRLKDTIIRLEKEKVILEGKLKNTKVPNVSRDLVEELERDRAKLLEELKAVRMTNQIKTQSPTLSDVIEAQERKIATLKVAQKGEAVLAEEMERLIESKSRLQQTNLRLEAQNLELKMQLEKSRLSDLTPREDMNSETESVRSSPKGKAKVGKNRADLERTVIVLKRVVEKLQAENKKLHTARLSDVHDKGYVEKLQIELQRCQENYLDAIDKCSALEEELKQAKEKLKLFDCNDLAEELAATKAQLAQKCQLLSKVKVLLENAVIREKALKEQVYDLEKLVPPERLRGTYHEKKS